LSQSIGESNELISWIDVSLMWLQNGDRMIRVPIMSQDLYLSTLALSLHSNRKFVFEFRHICVDNMYKK